MSFLDLTYTLLSGDCFLYYLKLGSPVAAFPLLKIWFGCIEGGWKRRYVMLPVYVFLLSLADCG
jgi:hypothetical protein